MIQRVTLVAIRALVVAIFTVAVGASPVRAQGEGAVVRGQVLAAANETQLAGASVVLKSLGTAEEASAITDEDGRFSFQNVRPGGYIAAGSLDGFVTRDVRFVLGPREIKIVTLSLALRSIDVNVSVTADATAVRSTHSPSSMVLTDERLDTLPAAQRTTLPEAIVVIAPGMIRGHDDFVHVRGHEMALNPFINGVSFWENPHALLSAGLNLDIIETANVMTGGFPAEYGNRFGGVVDIVTKSGFSMRNRAGLSVGGGQAGRRNVSGEFGGHRGRFGYYISGALFESDRFLSPPDPEAIHDSARGGHLFTRIDAHLGGVGALKLLFMGDGANAQIPRTPLDLELRPLASATQRTRQQTAIVGWNRTTPGLAVDASFYQRWSRLRLLPAEGPLTARAAVTRELLTAGGKADVTRVAGRHAVKAGVDAVVLRPEERLSYDYTGFSALTHRLGLPHIHFAGGGINFSAPDTGHQVSLYVQDSIQLGPRVTADLGIRVDRHDLVTTATHASPRVNVAFQADRAVLHASYNRFFVPPAIEGVLSSSGGLTAQIREIGRALPPLKPTTEDQVELGASAPVGPLHVAVTGYYRASDNPVHTTVWPDSRVYSYASFDRAQAYGLEFKADAPTFARYGVTGYVNYALGRVNFYNPVTGGFITEAEHLADENRFLAPMDQTHTLTSGVTYRHARTGLWIGTAMEYGSGTPIGHGGADDAHSEDRADDVHVLLGGSTSRVPAHATTNVSFGIELLRRSRQRPRLSLQVDLENVTNTVYLVAQDSVFSPAQFSIPRLVSVTAKVRF